MQWNERIGQKCHFITLRNSHFFHVKCKQPTTTKMRQIFIAQKLYCACRVLSLAAIRSKYYFNYILNRTRTGRERFDRPRVYYSLSPSAINYAYIGTVRSCQSHQKIYCYIWRLFPECRIKRCLRPSVRPSVCLSVSWLPFSRHRRDVETSNLVNTRPRHSNWESKFDVKGQRSRSQET